LNCRIICNSCQILQLLFEVVIALVIIAKKEFPAFLGTSLHPFDSFDLFAELACLLRIFVVDGVDSLAAEF